MSIFAKVSSAIERNSIDDLIACYHQDFVFISHKDGTRMNRNEFYEMVGGYMNSGAYKVRNQRCVYENDEIMVSHSFMDFPDGTSESVLISHKLYEGKIIETETGATIVSQ